MAAFQRNSAIVDRLQAAVEFAAAAGELTLRYWRDVNVQVEWKQDQSPVTIADREAEQLLRQRIGERFPRDGIVGEELPPVEGSSGFQWILDPIDGTKSFVHGVPLYTTLVAVLQDDEPCLGVVRAPAVDETVYASKGGGAWHQVGRREAQPARVSSVGTMAEGLLLTTEVAAFATCRKTDALPSYLELQRAARLARTWGDGYGYLLVATGRAEAMIDPEMNLWDAAPLQTIIQEAGGHFSDWSGAATIRSGEAVATNGLVHDEVLAILKDAK